MKPEVWAALFAACWLIALSPGAGALLAMSHGQAYGVRKTSATIAGQQAGLLVLILAAGCGAGALLTASPLVFLAFKLMGAAYLVYLGVTQWRNRTLPSALQAEAGRHARARALTGFLTNATNPKGMVFMAAVLPQFMDPHSTHKALELAVIAATVLSVDALVMHGYALVASRFAQLLGNPRAFVWQQRFFGSLLMLAGLVLLLVETRV